MPIVCKSCGSVDDYRQEKSGPHVKAVCNGCDKYIQFLPQGFTGESLMYFGKYKDKKLKDIPPDYFIWLYENTKVSGSLKSYIVSNLQQFRQRINESK